MNTPLLAAAMTAAVPGANQTTWLPILASAMDASSINMPRRIAAFLGQISVEAGPALTETAENLNYTHALRIMAVWPSRFPTLDSAQPFVNNPEGLANCVYANRMGNGPPESGDGWRFRGLGLIQITGRIEYEAFAQAVGREVDDAAAWAATPPGAAASAVWFWGWKSLNTLADIWDLQTLTRCINGGLTGYPDREKACNAALAALGETT